MNRRTRHQQRGFTLAEILVTTAIFAVIMIAALTIYDQSNRVFKSGTESADMQQSTRIGFDKLVADLRMAGFDYNRGGDPVGNGQFPQQDEQIEYAGKNAVVFRANFNYNTGSATGNGLEPAYTPIDPITAIQIFPFVTTSNNEIVAYVLRSADNTKNTGSISFYLDSSMPRTAYPGGAAESLMTISSALCATCGVDTTNANPPYTLYRETVTDILNQQPGTPVAENIRSLNFFYYTDTNGATVLKNNDGPPATNIANTRDADGTTPTSASATFTNDDGTTTTLSTGAIGGAGRYDPASPGTAANFGDRLSRATIQSVRVNVVGMNANPEPSYTQKTETIARIKNYRQYQLSALIVPRNLGLTGFPEPVNAVPAPPTLTGICTAACAAPVLCWNAPIGGGPTLEYRIEWDTSASGSFSNFIRISDPSATTAIIPDDGLINPSLTWYYHILAVNEIGPSIPSQILSVQPRNSTKPMPPAAASIATTSATNYAVSLGWTAPSTNDPAMATMTCTGAGCTTDPAVIPPQELISYRIYRGLVPNFDPAAAGQSVTVLTTGGPSQPTTSPGAPVSWNDSPANSAFPPGTCVPYYYRMRAVDRCVLNPGYNVSGNPNDSISTLSPPVGQNAIAGTASDLSTALAVAPLNLTVNTATSSCPAPASLNCQIDLTWSITTADTASNVIGVDNYRIFRYRKKQLDPGFVPDMTFGTSGSVDKSGSSQSNAGTISYSDSTAVAQDTSDNSAWYYEYKVAAKDCRLGQLSLPVDFPKACAVNPIVVQSGATNGASTADTPATAWIMNSGDTISVTPPGGLIISKVIFESTIYPAGTLVDSPVVVAAPFQYVWTDRSDSQIYQVRITVVTSTGCTETHVKYVQDQSAAACAFANQPFAAIVLSSGNSADTFLTETYTLTNSGPDPLQLASKPINLRWSLPAGDVGHGDMTMFEIDYGAIVDPFSAGPGTVSRTIPGTVGNVAPGGGTLTITIIWRYSKFDPVFVGQPLATVCLDYIVASDPTVPRHCNLVGQSASTSNPTACDP